MGDALNGMDGVDVAEDAWTAPIFRSAHLAFPRPRDPATNA